MIFA
jgi:hypothetical protein